MKSSAWDAENLEASRLYRSSHWRMTPSAASPSAMKAPDLPLGPITGGPLKPRSGCSPLALLSLIFQLTFETGKTGQSVCTGSPDIQTGQWPRSSQNAARNSGLRLVQHHCKARCVDRHGATPNNVQMSLQRSPLLWSTTAPLELTTASTGTCLISTATLAILPRETFSVRWGTKVLEVANL